MVLRGGRPGSDAEGAVRAYLNYLVDPDSVTDHAHMADLQARLADEADPMKRLRIASEIVEASDGDGSALEARFIAVASDWAKADGIPVGAFRTVGVSDAVLRKAGLLGRQLATAKRRGGRARSGAARVTAEDMQAWALAQPDPITIRQIAESLGGSLVTAKKALDQLIEVGSMQSLGQMPDHTGPGRAPTRYGSKKQRRRSSSS